jgi:DNA-directed RNA polymerase subunit RPC12/RpoP
MGRKHNKCVICGGALEFNEELEQYRCSECNANYEANLFKPAKNVSKPKRGKIKINICTIILAVVMTIYLFWFIYRRF